ncbi:MAG: hypothetical protein NXI24_19475 [bacterium]|nr:hypothetical protein [bacterium]
MPERKGRRGSLLFGLIVLLLTLAGAELLVRMNPGPELQFRRAERALHCLDSETGQILLCPNRRLEFEHPAGFQYGVTTNARGERTAYPDSHGSDGDSNQSRQDQSAQDHSVHDPDQNPSSDSARPEVWLIGDSIAMGYGNDDREVLAYLLARDLPQYRIRNLGVDSLGSCGILSVFQRALAERQSRAGSAGGGPRHTIWIFNPSDYTDDLRDLRRGDSVLLSAAFRTRFWLTKTFALPDFFRSALAHRNPEAETESPGEDPGVQTVPAPIVSATAAPRDPNHPTYVCAREIFQLAGKHHMQQGHSLILLVYPDIDRQNGGPLASDPLKAPIIELARAAPGVRLRNLQALFDEHRHLPDLYLPEDGHPGPDSQELFRLGVRPLLD